MKPALSLNLGTATPLAPVFRSSLKFLFCLPHVTKRTYKCTHAPWPHRHVKNKMATEIENASSAMDKLSVNDVNGAHEKPESPTDNDNNWGFPLEDLYRLAVLFYKGNTHCLCRSLANVDNFFPVTAPVNWFFAGHLFKTEENKLRSVVGHHMYTSISN